MTRRFDSILSQTAITTLCATLASGMLLAGCQAPTSARRADAHADRSQGAVADHNQRAPRQRPVAQAERAAPAPASRESVDVIADAPVAMVEGGAVSVDQRAEPAPEPEGTERYAEIDEPDFIAVSDRALSTFAIDVDTAAYANVRRYIENGQRPPRDAVRIEEMLNAFHYDDPAPVNDEAIAIFGEVAVAPWAPEHRIARVSMKAKEIARQARPASNLVFLVDVSGSMSSRLPLLQRSLSQLVDQLDQRDSVSLVVYAGAAGLVLPPTNGSDKSRIKHAITNLRSGGSTAGAAGINLAYLKATEAFIEGGTNRVFLATDGDFNVGPSSNDALVKLVRGHADNGIALTVLGFGMGNYNDHMLEQIADKGDGNYAYIDSDAEAHKVLVEGLVGNMVTVAKDVKFQVAFNPGRVAAWRLIGYENRLLNDEDFRDDKKDAGEIGAGHTVTALYELVPLGAEKAAEWVPDDDRNAPADTFITVRCRYQKPVIGHPEATELTKSVSDTGLAFTDASEDLRFSASVAAFGMLLRGSKHKGSANYADVQQWARASAGHDRGGHRAGFVRLVEQASTVMGHSATASR